MAPPTLPRRINRRWRAAVPVAALHISPPPGPRPLRPPPRHPASCWHESGTPAAARRRPEVCDSGTKIEAKNEADAIKIALACIFYRSSGPSSCHLVILKIACATWLGHANGWQFENAKLLRCVEISPHFLPNSLEST